MSGIPAQTMHNGDCEEAFRGGTWSEDNEGGATSFI